MRSSSKPAAAFFNALLGASRADALSFSQAPLNLLKRKAVEHAGGGYTTLAGHFDTPMGQVEFADRVCIGIYTHEASQLERAPVPAPVKIETPWIGVDLHSHAVLGTGGKDSLDIHLVAGAT